MRDLSAIVLLLSTLLGVSPACALDAPRLKGWWLASDRPYAALYEKGLTMPFDELLVVEADGRFEDRTIVFDMPDAQSCRDEKRCSDAPAAFRGRLEVSGDRLSFAQREATDARIDRPGVDGVIRAQLVASMPEWSARLDEGDAVLVLRDRAGRTRRLTRVDPDRLRRVYMAFLAAEVLASVHWSCYVAKTEEARSRPLAPRSAAVERMLRAGASIRAYEAAFEIARTIDDAPASGLDLRRFTPEQFVTEPAARPKASSDAEALRLIGSRLAWLRVRESGRSKAEADAAMADVAGKPQDPPLGEDDATTLVGIKRKGANARHLYCLDLKADDGPPSDVDAILKSLVPPSRP